MEQQVDGKERENSKASASPRGVLEILNSGADSDNSSNGSCGSAEKLTVQKEEEEAAAAAATAATANREGYGSQWKNMIEAIKKKSVRRFSVIPLLTNYDLTKMNLWKKLARIQNSEDDCDDSGSVPIVKHSWRNFEYKELAAATDNFNSGEISTFFLASFIFIFSVSKGM